MTFYFVFSSSQDIDRFFLSLRSLFSAKQYVSTVSLPSATFLQIHTARHKAGDIHPH